MSETRDLNSFSTPIDLTHDERDQLRQRKIKKHHVATILLHWFNAISWLFLLTTGAGLLVSDRYRVMPRFALEIISGVFSGKANLLKFHIWLGVIWFIVLTAHAIFGYRNYLRKKEISEIEMEGFAIAFQCALLRNENLCLDSDDLKWLKIRVLKIFGKTDEPLPPQGSFNAGQKLFAILAAIMTPIIMITGLIMAFHLFGMSAVA